MKELPPAGQGNGGRTCFSCSCLLLIMTTLFTLLLFGPPIGTMLIGLDKDKGGVDFADTFAIPAGGAWWTTPTCLSTCCCIGVLMFFLSIWLILIDDPSKAK